jgi:hypothetical protein
MPAIAIPRAIAARSVPALRSQARFGLLMVVTLVLFTTGLDRYGWATAFYAAAVQAGTRTWRAFVFG